MLAMDRDEFDAANQLLCWRWQTLDWSNKQ